MLTRLLRWWGSGAADLVGRYGTKYIGNFEPKGRGIVGYVADLQGINRYPPVSITVFRDGNLVGSTVPIERNPNGWRFAVELADAISPNDILRDRIAVIAVDNLGAQSALKMLGAVQLEYLRESEGAAFERELTIDFSREGNSQEYVREGWSGAEPDHTWTEGTESTIAVTFASPGSRYGLEVLAWPFIVPDKLLSQTLEVWVSNLLIGRFHANAGHQLFECVIPPELTQARGAIIRFKHSDAARPSDFSLNQDNRMIALAFRRLRLNRYLDN